MLRLVEIGPVVLEKKIFKIFNIILHFRYYLPLEKGVAIHLNKLKSPSSKDALCQVWLKLVQWFWIRRFLNIFNIILHFRCYLPLEKGVALRLSSTQGYLVQSLVEIGPVVMEKKLKMWKVYRQTDDRQHVLRKAHLSFQLRWAKKLIKNMDWNSWVYIKLKLLLSMNIFNEIFSK